MMLALLIGILVGIGFAGHFISRTRARIAEVGKVDGTEAKLKALSSSIRSRAKQSIQLRYRTERLKDEASRLGPKLRLEEDRLLEAEAAVVRTYVLDDRKMEGDSGFVFMISHPAFSALAPGAPLELVESWRKGRRCVIWAADVERATKRAALRCSPQKGYVYGPTVLPLGPLPT